MAILVECSFCHRKESLKNKLCPCGADLVKLKRSNSITYWISYRLPGGKQRRELVGTSVEEARDADGKRRGQKRENRIFDIKPETKMTFNELKVWYLGLEKTKALGSYPSYKTSIENFCSQFGDRIISSIKPSELENLQVKRQKQGKALGSIDHEIIVAKVMVNKAFRDGIVGGDTLRVFKGIGKLLKQNANARNRVLSPEEFARILDKMRYAGQAPLLTAFSTGMREGEVLNLVWSKIDFDNRMIRLEAKDTKDREPRDIPISNDLLAALRRMPRALHDPHVFLSDGKRIKADTFRKWVEEACIAAGVSYGRFVKGGFIPHDLRHGFVTYMRKAGADRSVIMEITGHATEAMFHRYNEVDRDDCREAMNQFERFLNNSSASVDQTVDQKR